MKYEGLTTMALLKRVHFMVLLSRGGTSSEILEYSNQLDKFLEYSKLLEYQNQIRVVLEHYSSTNRYSTSTRRVICASKLCKTGQITDLWKRIFNKSS